MLYYRYTTVNHRFIQKHVCLQVYVRACIHTDLHINNIRAVQNGNKLVSIAFIPMLWPSGLFLILASAP